VRWEADPLTVYAKSVPTGQSATNAAGGFWLSGFLEVDWKISWCVPSV
jgi:hypothetical protein